MIFSFSASFTASVWKEGRWYVAQCLDVDVASQAESEKEALELRHEKPRATLTPVVRKIEGQVGVG